MDYNTNLTEMAEQSREPERRATVFWKANFIGRRPVTASVIEDNARNNCAHNQALE